MSKILILEDEEVLGKIYSKHLINAGHKVVWSKTAEEAEEKAKVFNADIALLDHGIHNLEKNGIGLIPIIKKHYPETKIIMLSNFSEFDLKKNALEAGADSYLIKLNTKPKKLIEHIEYILKK